MKKNYNTPAVMVVKVNTCGHLCLNSVNTLRGEASGETQGMSRESKGDMWDDEE